MVGPRDDLVAGLQGGIHVTDLLVDARGEVGLAALADTARIGILVDQDVGPGQRLVHVGYRVKLFVLDDDVIQGRLGLGQGFGHDHGHPVADEPRLVRQ